MKYVGSTCERAGRRISRTTEHSNSIGAKSFALLQAAAHDGIQKHNRKRGTGI